MMNIFEMIKEKCIYKQGIGRKSLGAFLEILEEVEEEYNNGWIPCRERLPEEWEYYLVSDGQSTYIAEYADYEWRYHCTDSNEIYVCEDIIAWQPLPAAFEPKGE